MKEIVASDDLEIGMFVADLDRPWIDSPFLLQGFLIEDEETLDRLRGLCRYVSVDRTLSVGDAHRGRRIEDIASRVGESLQGRPRRAAVVDADDTGLGGLGLLALVMLPLLSLRRRRR